MRDLKKTAHSHLFAESDNHLAGHLHNHSHNQSRRQLIKALAALGVLASAQGLLAAGNPKSKKSLGVALVGLGSYSRNQLAPALQMTQWCHLAGIVTGSPEKIPLWQKKYQLADKNIYSYDTMHTLADNPDIDVVYIVTPTGLHARYSIIGASAGKHVWCEKHMAMNVAECEAIIAACKKNNVQLTIGYRMQHEPNTQRVMQMATEKPYGKIQTITAEAGYRFTGNDHGWRSDPTLGGGALYDMGVYPLNAARYTAGEEPIALTARTESTRALYKDVDETTLFSLEFPSGAIAKCATSYGKSANILRAECEKGWYELQPFQSYSGVRGRTSDGILLNQPIANQQAQQMDNDAQAILNKSPVLVPGEEGMRDIRLVEAIFKAAKEGQRITV